MGCVRPPVVSPHDAFREIESTEAQIGDDLDFAGLSDAIARQRALLLRSKETIMTFGATTISRGRYAEALDALASVVNSEQSKEEKNAYIAEHFRFLELY